MISRQLMCDIESLSTDFNAVILTLGAVIFDPFSDSEMQEFYIRLNVEEQEALGSKIDPNTIEWWSKQDPAIIEEAFTDENRISFYEGMQKFHKFAWNCSKFWSHGSSYDLVILQIAFQKLKMHCPWSYYDIRDTRTLFDLADAEMPQAQKHNALEDAKRQAIGVRNVYKKLGYTNKR